MTQHLPHALIPRQKLREYRSPQAGEPRTAARQSLLDTGAGVPGVEGASRESAGASLMPWPKSRTASPRATDL
jgi:hypothetical protein